MPRRCWSICRRRRPSSNSATGPFSPRGRDLSKVRDRLTRSGRAFDAATLDRIRRLRGAEREVATSGYYGSLGYAAYELIGTDARRDSPAMDVNLDLAQAYGFTRSFDLVTNNNGGAHIFDQHALFANMHRLCRQGGAMVHLAPFIGSVNHGFFSVHPLLYTALADANRYQILRLAIVNAEGAEVMIGTDAARNLAKAVRRAVRAWPDLSVLAVLRKSLDAPFMAPVHDRAAPTTVDARAGAVGARRVRSRRATGSAT